MLTARGGIQDTARTPARQQRARPQGSTCAGEGSRGGAAMPFPPLLRRQAPGPTTAAAEREKG